MLKSAEDSSAEQAAAAGRELEGVHAKLAETQREAKEKATAATAEARRLDEEKVW